MPVFYVICYFIDGESDILFTFFIRVEVYTWIVLALSIRSDFWSRWLVHAQGFKFGPGFRSLS
jgi:hypothetical protein